MDIKGKLKSIDWQGIALRHCEKAGIAVVSCLLVLFLWKGVSKSLKAGGVAPEQIAQLADDLEKKLAASTWDDSLAEREGVKNPPFQDKIRELEQGVDPTTRELRDKYLWRLTNFGTILRAKPEIVSPHDLLAAADRGPISLYRVDAKGKFVEREQKVTAAETKKDEDQDDPKKKPKTGKASKAGDAKGKMADAMEKMKGGGKNMADRYRGGMMGGMAGGPMGGMMGGPTGGAGGAGGMGAGEGIGMAGDEGGMNFGGGSQLLAGQTPSGSVGGRKSASSKNRFAGAIEAAKKAKPGEKLPTSFKIKEEDIRGVRWVVVTALLNHLEQQQKYNEALNTRRRNQPDEPPEYHHVNVERRYLLKDGTLSDWTPFDAVQMEKIVKRIPATDDPKRRQPELEVFRAANAIFQGLVMPLPELAIQSEWGDVDREAARDAAEKAATVVGGADRGFGGEDEGEQSQEGAMGELFGGGRGGAGPGGGALGGNQPMAAGGPIGAGGGGRMAGGPPGGQMSAMMGGGPIMGGGAAGAGGMNQQMGNLRGDSRGGGAGGGREGVAGGYPGGATKGATAAQKKVQRTNAEIVQIRFIDYTVEPEHTYQYRFKVVVHNPNYRRNQLVDTSQKKVEFLESDEWSEPSPPVFVTADTEYFVLERIKAREEAKLQVHNWLADLGDWNLKDFTVKPGDPIGAKVREHPIVNWDGVLEKKDYDFFTDDLLLDVSGGNRQFVFVDENGKDVTYNETMPAEIFVVDRLGDLAIRNEDRDKHDRTRRDRETYVADLKSKAQKEEKKGAAGKTESGAGKDFNEDLPNRKGGGTSGSQDAK